MVGNSFTAPSGMLVGTGSNTPAFGDLLLGSPMDPTRHSFDSRSGLGFVAQFEHTVLSGDITTGSLVHEIGMIPQSGGNVFFRDLMPEIEIFGSTIIQSILNVNIK